MFNYSSPSVKNSALLVLARIPHKLAGRLIFGIWCRAVLLFLLSSVGLLALLRSTATHVGIHTRKQTHIHSHKYTYKHQWCNRSVSFVCDQWRPLWLEYPLVERVWQQSLLYFAIYRIIIDLYLFSIRMQNTHKKNAIIWSYYKKKYNGLVIKFQLSVLLLNQEVTVNNSLLTSIELIAYLYQLGWQCDRSKLSIKIIDVCCSCSFSRHFAFWFVFQETFKFSFFFFFVAYNVTGSI